MKCLPGGEKKYWNSNLLLFHLSLAKAVLQFSSSLAAPGPRPPQHPLLWLWPPRPEEALDGVGDPGTPYGPPMDGSHMDPSLLDLRSYGPPMAMGPPEPPNMGPLDLGPHGQDLGGPQHSSPKYICL